MRSIKILFGLFFLTSVLLTSVCGSWVDVWLKEGKCGDTTFYSGDTVYFYFQSKRSCNATVTLETPWRDKVLMEETELNACKVHRLHYDIGEGVTRSDWWTILVEARDGEGYETEAECTFYVPVKKETPPPTPTQAPTATPTTQAPSTIPATQPSTTLPATQAPTTAPPSTAAPTTQPPTTEPLKTYPAVRTAPAPTDYTPLIYAGILAAIIISLMVVLVMTKKH
ncbi:MAG: hypothetical protein U9N35_05560 [Euryarchaeota archaeon]|nr:hypothetical protein [Euryarchaeota archaeon]